MNRRGSKQSNVSEALRQYGAAELDALKGVIDYSERMIYDEGQRHPYTSLRRQAYTKTVVIQTENRGRQEFRVSSTPAVITPNRIGYATPHSPVGRLCSFLKLGDQGDSSAWGHYKVTETRLFRRYDGADFEPNVRNFLQMQVAGEQIDDEVTDLQAFVRSHAGDVAAVAGTVTTPLPAGEVLRQPDAPVVEAPKVQVVRFQSIEDDADEIVGDIDIADIDADAVQPRQGGYFGLNEIFYVDRTREQDQVISRSPIGPMFVEGIAGSGKTSAALGRTKMLCDFDARNVASREEFESIVGQSSQYWDGRFAGQFSQESSVGFVRTGELIQYLQETCRRLDLPNVPVREFKELRATLREHRKSGMRQWAGTDQVRAAAADTTMEWLHSADQAIAWVLADELLPRLPDVGEMVERFSAKAQPVVRRLVEEALRHVSQGLEKLAEELRGAETGRSGFALDRIASRVLQAIQDTRRAVLSRTVVWTTVGHRGFTAANERVLAQLLIDENAALYLQSERRLVWVGGGGALDSTLKLIDSTGKPTSWCEDSKSLLEKGEVLVEDAAGRRFAGKAFSVDELYLVLLPESVEKLYFEHDSSLRRMRIDRGLGRVKFPLAANVQPDESGQGPAAQQPESAVRNQSVDAAFGVLLRRRMLAPLTDVAALYRTALTRYARSFPDPAVAEKIREQLERGELTDADVDLVLCLYQVVGRGAAGGAPAALLEPPSFQSVFVDEVQDFTEQQVFLMADQANPQYRAVTVVGDLAQKLHAGESIDIRSCFPGQALEYVRLGSNLRQADAPHLALFSACFRYALQDKSAIPPSLVARARQVGASVTSPTLISCTSRVEMDARIVETLGRAQPGESAVVLFKDLADAEAAYGRLKHEMARRMLDASLSGKVDLSRRFVRHFTSVEHVKGLEFDVVVVCDVEKYDLQQAMHRNRLYVAVTRPRRELTLLSSGSSVDKGLQAVMDLFGRLRVGHRLDG